MRPRTCIVHDPGHGGESRGIEHGGIVEADWVLAMAIDCEAELSSWAIDQYLTRRSDVALTLTGRGNSAEAANATLVISHHVNGAFNAAKVIGQERWTDSSGVDHDEPILGQPEPNQALDGLMVFYLAGCHESREIAAAFMRAAPAELQRRKQIGTPATPGNWTQNAYNVLSKHEGRPAILVEWGFATSPRDVGILTSTASRPAMVTACKAAVGRHVELRHAA